jgi:N-acetylglucosamine-6-phosphate deacetylase
MITAFVNGSILTVNGLVRGKAVVIEHGRILSLVTADSVPDDEMSFDLAGGTLLPGFIDVQVNGGGDVLFNEQPTVEGLRAIARGHARFGTTGFLPTLISGDLAEIANAISAVDAAIAAGVPGVLGIHIEGPYLSPKRRGIHNPAEFPRLDAAALDVLSSLKHGKTVVTLAPDATTPADVEALTKAGVIVSIGHSDASYEQTRAALKAGARGFTHLFNAMSPLGTRAPGVVGAALDDRASWCGIIADGHHVHPAALRIAFACRGAGKLMLVTDAMPPVGGARQSFTLQGRAIRTEDGACLGPDGTLAGSATDMATIFRKSLAIFGIDLATASRLASTNAADFLSLSNEYGVIAPGARADFVLLDEALQVRQTWIGGTPQQP